jgi:hypothetical protein
MTTICMHAWYIDENGDQTHCDEGMKWDGWTVYTRTDAAEQGADEPFDLSEEMDFDTREAALVQAQARAAMLRCDLVIY